MADRMDQLAFLTLSGISYTLKTNGALRNTSGTSGHELNDLEFASDVSAPTESQGLDDIDLDDAAGETATLSFGTSNAVSVTISFWVKSNLTGTYTYSMQQADNSAKQVSQTYTINAANTWEKKTFTFAGDVNGVINNDNEELWDKLGKFEKNKITYSFISFLCWGVSTNTYTKIYLLYRRNIPR